MTLSSPLTTTWTPRHDQVIVRQLEASNVSRGGLLLPEQHRDKPQQGLVVAVGPDVPAGVAAGDVVAFGKFAGIPFDDPLSGAPLLVMRELECILLRPKGTVEITVHTIPSGTDILHEAGLSCEFCPTPDLDRMREEFRAAKASELAGEAQP